MTAFFVDTSALAKRYVIENGSDWVRSWILPRYQHSIFISRLTTLEMLSLLVRKQREGLITAREFARIRNNLYLHLRRQYTVVEVDALVLSIAHRLIVKHPLRALDAVQLASAVQAAKFTGIPLTFVTADARLLTAATAEGLPADDPNQHP